MPKRGGQAFDDDRGWRKLVTQFKAQKKGATVFIGVTRSEGTYAGKGKPISVGQVAAIHEFGAPKAGIPERSFIRGAIDANQGKIRRTLNRLALAVSRGGMSANMALGILGESVSQMIKKRITDGIPPALKPATVARKGSSKPLIDTGQLLNSIGWELVPGAGTKPKGKSK